ncbi:hypothetical protein V6N12_007562 [Hibiscus sabdariffa]|uniref:Reverse transcriptase Ty1/copia-type domain-containing protein n=1 Tax=Hibiscus sabdariffa TaxID=183260 RepID=A0ABR2F244_9ROSI
MQEELNQFDRSKVWTLVERPNDKSTIGTKWAFRNKLDDSGNIVRIKARLVEQGYTQEEGIDFDETYAPVARMESIMMLLAFACHHEFKLFQMDVKSEFLNGFINEEVYVEQPPGFEDPKFPNHVFKLSKGLYGLKQAPRAWYERLSTFLVKKCFNKGKVDTTLFTKKKGKDILVVQIYVDDIIFGSTNDLLCQEFAKLMQGEFEISMMAELSLFLGLQIKKRKDDIFINQAKYIKEKLKKFGLENVKPQATPMSSSTNLDKDEEGKCVDSKLYRSMIGSLLYLTASRPDIMLSVCLCSRFQANPKESHLKAVKRIFRYLKDRSSLGLWYPRDSTFDLHAYLDADYGGCKIDRKSTSAKMTFWCIEYQYWMNQYRYPFTRIDSIGWYPWHPKSKDLNLEPLIVAIMQNLTLPVDIQALFAQLNANLDTRFNAIDARFTSLNEDVNAPFNSIDARYNAFETHFKAQEDTLHRVETELSAYHLEWSTHIFRVQGLCGGEEEDEEEDGDSIAPS